MYLQLKTDEVLITSDLLLVAAEKGELGNKFPASSGSRDCTRLLSVARRFTVSAA